MESILLSLVKLSYFLEGTDTQNTLHAIPIALSLVISLSTTLYLETDCIVQTKRFLFVCITTLPFSLAELGKISVNIFDI